MNVVWTTEPDGYIEPRVGSSGAAAYPPITIIEVFRQVIINHGTKPALLLKRPVDVR